MSQVSTNLPLKLIRPGHEYPGANINARSYGGKEIADKKRSILEWGILQPLLVCPSPKAGDPNHYIIAGNKRQLALCDIPDLSKVPGFDVAKGVPVLIRDDATPGTALAMSIVENEDRENLSPVNLFEKMLELLGKGFSEADLAKRFNKTPQVIERILRLGRLDDVVRGAWRDGKMRDEEAQAFTNEPDKARQRKIFQELTKARDLRVHNIRQAIGGNQVRSADQLAYVGREAYAKRGGRVTEDLFAQRGDNTIYVNDKTLLAKMVKEKAAADTVKLKAEGWGWVEFDEDVKTGHYSSWTWWHKNSNCKKQDRKKYGAIISIQHGKLKITRGVAKPGEHVETAKKAKKRAAGDTISNAIAMRLSEWLTAGAKAAMSQQAFDLYMPAMLAAIASGSGNVEVEVRGIEHARMKLSQRNEKPTTFSLAFAKYEKMARAKDRGPLFLEFAAVVGRSLNFFVQSAGATALKKPGVACLLKAMDAKSLEAELRAQFSNNAEDYFKSIATKLALVAIEEACGKLVKSQWQNRRGKDVKAAAARLVPPTGWLPPQMRSPHYKGPDKKKR